MPALPDVSQNQMPLTIAKMRPELQARMPALPGISWEEIQKIKKGLELLLTLC
jgi:hypothetical protein